MSRVGRCIDNGPMEGFWGILKSEMYYLRKFTDEQEMLYSELWDIDNKMVAKRERQLFSFGFIIAKELDAETKIIE